MTNDDHCDYCDRLFSELDATCLALGFLFASVCYLGIAAVKLPYLCLRAAIKR